MAGSSLSRLAVMFFLESCVLKYHFAYDVLEATYRLYRYLHYSLFTGMPMMLILFDIIRSLCHSEFVHK